MGHIDAPGMTHHLDADAAQLDRLLPHIDSFSPTTRHRMLYQEQSDVRMYIQLLPKCEWLSVMHRWEVTLATLPAPSPVAAGSLGGWG